MSYLKQTYRRLSFPSVSLHCISGTSVAACLHVVTRRRTVRVLQQTYQYFTRCRRYGNPEEEEKRGFMGAINVQDFNPNIRIFVQALTVGMRQRLIKVDTHTTEGCVSVLNVARLVGKYSRARQYSSGFSRALQYVGYCMESGDCVRIRYVASRTNCLTLNS